MAWLRCEHTITKEQRVFAIRKVLTSIGRARGNDLVLSDPMVGKSHASLMRSGTSYSITPNDRSSPLYHNGRRVRSAPLGEGDVLLVGAWQLTFTLEEPASDAAEGTDAPVWKS